MERFIPHPLLSSGQLQTIAAVVGGKAPEPRHTRHEFVPLPDGDKVLLSVDEVTRDDSQRPIILLMHGLGGSGGSPYMLRQSLHLNLSGFTVVRFHHRGCGPSHLDQAKDIYHSGRTADLHAVLEFIGGRWPGRSTAVIGYSLSGNLLLRYLGAGTHSDAGSAGCARPPAHLIKALAVCPPIDLESCSHALTAPRNWHIHRYISYHVTLQARAREARRPAGERIHVPLGLNIRMFDQMYTAPLAGFRSREDYYGRCSAQDVLSQVNIPTTILAAEDDPIVPAGIFTKATLSPQVTLRIESGGGHMGFMSHRPTNLGNRRWLDAYVLGWAHGIVSPKQPTGRG